MVLKKKKLKAHKVFLRRLLNSLILAFLLILISLLMGMWGFHYFENLSWLDSYTNAALILSGMGPLDPPKTPGGKFFEGSYALFSGIIFLIIVGIIFVPIFHKILKKFQIEEDNEENRSHHQKSNSKGSKTSI